MQLLMTLALLTHSLFTFLLVPCWQNTQAFHFEEGMLLTLCCLHWSAELLVYWVCNSPEIRAAIISIFISQNALSCSGPQLKGTFSFDSFLNRFGKLR